MASVLPHEKVLHENCDEGHICGLVPANTPCPQYSSNDWQALYTDGTIDGPGGLSDVRLCAYPTTDKDGFDVFDPAVLMDAGQGPKTGLDRAKWWFDNFQDSTLARNLGLKDQFVAKVLPSAISKYILPKQCPSLANTTFQQLDPSGSYAGKCLPIVSSDGGEAAFAAKLADTAMFRQDVDQLLHGYCYNNAGDPRCSCIMSTDPENMFQAYSAAAGSPPECWWVPCKDTQFYHLFKDNHPDAAICGNSTACKNIAIVVGNKYSYIDLDQYITGCSGGDNGGGTDWASYLKKNALMLSLVGGGALVALVAGAFLLKKLRSTA